jgi:nitroimidazol reductase NimA-like FMN-containing flavoprotein (pyridoxamine 5'-phosphate oxidase superfamily)
MGIKLAKFRDVANGLQAGQFAVGDRTAVNSLNDLDPTYKQLLDKPFACSMAVMGSDGRPNLTPMWFDYKDDKVLINVAAQRTKTKWIRKTPKVTILIVNPENMYHWISMKVTVDREILEDDPKEGAWVTEQLNGIWRKYITDGGDTYGLRDPSIDERRVLFVCSVDSIATFGQP